MRRHRIRPPANPEDHSADKLWDTVKLDFATIKVIVITAAVVVALLCVPVLFLLKNFVTFAALDKYLKVTDSVRPHILHNISEEIQTGYSKNVILSASSPNDTNLLFYAAKDQKVTLNLNVDVRSGEYQSIGVQVDGCDIKSGSEEIKHLYGRDLTNLIKTCAQENEPALHTLRVFTPKPLPRLTVLEVSSLVLVYERVHEHVENGQ